MTAAELLLALSPEAKEEALIGLLQQFLDTNADRRVVGQLRAAGGTGGGGGSGVLRTRPADAASPDAAVPRPRRRPFGR